LPNGKAYGLSCDKLAVVAEDGFNDQISVAAAAAVSRTATITSRYRRRRRARAVAEIGDGSFIGYYRPVSVVISRSRSAARQFYSGIIQVKMT
jgi:hypothetical protein